MADHRPASPPRRRPPRLLLVAMSLVAVSGCDRVKEKLAEKAAEKAIETASGGKVDLNSSSGGATIKDDKGGELQLGTQAAVPKDWPSSVPVYPGAAIAASMGTPQGKSLHLGTSDPPDKVVAFYKGKLPGKQTAFVDLGASKTITHEDGASKIAVIVTGAGDGKTQIVLSVSP